MYDTTRVDRWRRSAARPRPPACALANSPHHTLGQWPTPCVHQQPPLEGAAGQTHGRCRSLQENPQNTMSAGGIASRRWLITQKPEPSGKLITSSYKTVGGGLHCCKIHR